MSIIETKNLSREFKMGADTVRALDGVSFSVEEGEFLAIVGPSGSGKSTLLHIIGALDESTGGEIVVDGRPVSSMTEEEKARYRNEKVGFVFQDFNLIGHMTALENVRLPLMFSGAHPPEREDRARESLEAVGLSHRARHLPGELSGGERQRVAIARALATRPRILLADEPTGNLDSKTGGEVVKILKDLNKKRNLTVIVVTHNDSVSRAATRILNMFDGRFADTATGTGGRA